MLRESVHGQRLLGTGIQVVNDELQSLAVTVDDCGGPAVGERKLFLHIDLHVVEFLDGFIDDSDRELADHHVVLSDLFGHIINLVFEFAQLMYQSFGLLFMPDGLQV